MAGSGPDNPLPARPRSDAELAALVRDRGAPLIAGLERHLPGAAEHAEATGSYGFAAAAALGHGRGRSELIREVAKLHEVGKVYLPAELAARPEPALGRRERARVAAHHEAGFRLARGAGIPDEACGWILRFRERFDGRGPERLEGEAIPIAARIARAGCECDRAVFAAARESSGDAAERARAAIERLRATAGSELDPRVVDALAAVLERAGGADAAAEAGAQPE